MTRRIGAAIAALALLLTIGAFAPAFVAAAPICTDGPYVDVYESSGLGGSHLRVCAGVDYTNLHNVAISGTCEGFVVSFANWDNCISSYNAHNMTSTYQLCGYDHSGFGSPLRMRINVNGSANLAGSSNDSISSLRWVSDTNPPVECP